MRRRPLRRPHSHVSLHQRPRRNRQLRCDAGGAENCGRFLQLPPRNRPRQSHRGLHEQAHHGVIFQRRKDHPSTRLHGGGCQRNPRIPQLKTPRRGSVFPFTTMGGVLKAARISINVSKCRSLLHRCQQGEEKQWILCLCIVNSNGWIEDNHNFVFLNIRNGNLQEPYLCVVALFSSTLLASLLLAFRSSQKMRGESTRSPVTPRMSNDNISTA